MWEELTTKQSTIEQIQRLLKTCKGYNCTWNIAVYPSNVYVCANGVTVRSFGTVAELCDWLLSQQPSKTITVEIDREDAEKFSSHPWLDAHNRRIRDTVKKALEA